MVVTSSLHGEQHFIHALENGADDCLARPVNPALLAAKPRHYGRVLGLQSRLSNLARRQRDMLDPVLTLDAYGRIEALNRAALTLADTAGRPVASGADCAAVLGLSLPDLRVGRECQLQRRSGAVFPAGIGLTEWRDEGRSHYTLELRDLTEQRAVERMKDEFLATVSHEPRTPLTSVLGALGLLAGGAASVLPAAALPLAEVAQRKGGRLSRLIDDVLDLTKLEGDRLVLHLRPLTLAPC